MYVCVCMYSPTLSVECLKARGEIQSSPTPPLQTCARTSTNVATAPPTNLPTSPFGRSHVLCRVTGFSVQRRSPRMPGSKTPAARPAARSQSPDPGPRHRSPSRRQPDPSHQDLAPQALGSQPPMARPRHPIHRQPDVGPQDSQVTASRCRPHRCRHIICRPH